MVREPAALNCDVRAGPESVEYIRQNSALFRVCEGSVICYLYSLQAVLDESYPRYGGVVQTKFGHRGAFPRHSPYYLAQRVRAHVAVYYRKCFNLRVQETHELLIFDVHVLNLDERHVGQNVVREALYVLHLLEF